MPQYIYQATRDGKLVSGEIAAARVSEAIVALEASGLTVESIRAQTPGQNTSHERTAFYSRLDAALAEPAELIAALESIAVEMPEKIAADDLKNLVLALRGGVTAEQFVHGESTAAWVPLVVRGLDSNSVADRYQHLLDDAQRESEHRRSLRSMLFYPMVLLMIGSVVVGLLSVFVLPMFDKMFLEFGLKIPAATQMLIGFSRQLTEHSLRTLGIALLIGLAIILFVRMWLHYALSTRILGFFTSGNSANLTAMARLSGSLAELLSIDAPLPDALQIAGISCRHHHFRKMADWLANDLAVNGTPPEASDVAHSFPATLLYALRSDSHAKPNVSLLRELSQMYRERVRSRLRWSTSFMGPITIVFVGALVGFVIIALFAPLVALINALS